MTTKQVIANVFAQVSPKENIESKLVEPLLYDAYYKNVLPCIFELVEKDQLNESISS